VVSHPAEMCYYFNPLSAELNPIFHLLALLGAHHILHVGRIRVKMGHGFFLTNPTIFAFAIRGQKCDKVYCTLKVNEI
jgi:hypothetical protein